MIVDVKNLGVIAGGVVDTSKPLIVFCGPNSTGKTYLSYLLYTIFSSSPLVDIDAAKVDEALQTQSFTLTLDDLNTYLRALGVHLKQRMYNIFGLAPTSNKSMFKSFDLTLTCTQDTYTDFFFSKKLERSFMMNGNPWLVVSKADNSDSLQVTYLREEESETQKRVSLANIIYSLMQEFAQAPSLGVRMLTVERNSIYTFKTELSLSRSELVDRVLEASVSGGKVKEMLYNGSSRYPLAIRDSLRIANDLENLQKSEGDYRIFAEQLEQELLHGSIAVDRATGAVEFLPESQTKKPKRLPIHMASSIVKTLSSLILYLKHMAKVNDLVIIDEPEMNMHPENQRILARIFAALVNKGLRMVVSTHSDYIIREFNNLIMANELLNQHNERISKMVSETYSKEESLDKNKMEVLYFKPVKRKVEVISLPLYRDGFSVESIDSTINAQNEVSQNLYDLLNSKLND